MTSESDRVSVDDLSCSYAMVLTRSLIAMCRRRIAGHRRVRRGRLQRAEDEKSAEGCQAKHQCGLATREVGGGTQQIIHRLVAHVLGKTLDPVRYPANDARELRRISVEVLCRALCRTCKMADELGSASHLI